MASLYYTGIQSGDWIVSFANGKAKFTQIGAALAKAASNDGATLNLTVANLSQSSPPTTGWIKQNLTATQPLPTVIKADAGMAYAPNPADFLQFGNGTAFWDSVGYGLYAVFTSYVDPVFREAYSGVGVAMQGYYGLITDSTAEFDPYYHVSTAADLGATGNFSASGVIPVTYYGYRTTYEGNYFSYIVVPNDTNIPTFYIDETNLLFRQTAVYQLDNPADLAAVGTAYVAADGTILMQDGTILSSYEDANDGLTYSLEQILAQNITPNTVWLAEATAALPVAASLTTVTDLVYLGQTVADALGQLRNAPPQDFIFAVISTKDNQGVYTAYEVVKIDSVVGNYATMTRGQNGTVAQTWANGFDLNAFSSQAELDAFLAAIAESGKTKVFANAIHEILNAPLLAATVQITVSSGTATRIAAVLTDPNFYLVGTLAVRSTNPIGEQWTKCELIKITGVNGLVIDIERGYLGYGSLDSTIDNFAQYHLICGLTAEDFSAVVDDVKQIMTATATLDATLASVQATANTAISNAATAQSTADNAMELAITINGFLSSVDFVRFSSFTHTLNFVPDSTPQPAGSKLNPIYAGTLNKVHATLSTASTATTTFTVYKNDVAIGSVSISTGQLSSDLNLSVAFLTTDTISAAITAGNGSGGYPVLQFFFTKA